MNSIRNDCINCNFILTDEEKNEISKRAAKKRHIEDNIHQAPPAKKIKLEDYKLLPGGHAGIMKDVKKLCLDNQFDKAQDTAGSIEDVLVRSKVQVEIIKQLCLSNQLNKAIKLTPKVESPQCLTESMYLVSLKLIGQGRIEEADKILEIKNGLKKPQNLINITDKLLEKDDGSHALKVLKLLPKGKFGFPAIPQLGKLYQICSKNGNIEEVNKFAATVLNPSELENLKKKVCGSNA